MVDIIATMRKLDYLSSFSASTYAQWLISQFDLLECSRSNFGKNFFLYHPVWRSEEDQYDSAEERLLENATRRCEDILDSVEIEEEGFDPTSIDDDFLWTFGEDLLNELDGWEQGVLLLAYYQKKNWYQNTLKPTGKSSIDVGYAYSQRKLLPKCIRFRLILRSNSSELLASICNRVLELHEESTEVHRYLAAAWPDAAVYYKSCNYEQQMVGPVTLPKRSFFRDYEPEMVGPVPLPKKRRSYCVLRSPHVNKDSREQFEIREHTRLIDFLYPTALTFEFLNQLDIPAGVSLILKVISPFEVKSDGVVID